jgi:transcriptional regulator with XRE-family HTH domain
VRREIEHRWRELGEFVREQRRLGQLSLRRLSELSGISNPYLSQIERGLRRPSAEILQQLARALQISAETLYVRAGILEDRAPGDDLMGAIRRSPDLTEDQKRTLIHVYQSFQAENPRRVRMVPDPSPPSASNPERRPEPTPARVGAEASDPPGGDPAGESPPVTDG